MPVATCKPTENGTRQLGSQRFYFCFVCFFVSLVVCIFVREIGWPSGCFLV